MRIQELIRKYSYKVKAEGIAQILRERDVY